MKKIYVTRRIPEIGIQMLRDKGYEIDINPKDEILSKKDLIKALSKKPYDIVLSLLTDTIDAEVLAAVPMAQMVSNYAVGFNNIDIAEAAKRGIVVSNTPGASSEAVAEHTAGLVLALATRIVEGDAYMRAGKYKGWDPMLLWGTDLENKVFGILGAGRIGIHTARIFGRGLGMHIMYYDVTRNEQFESEYGAVFCPTPEEVIRSADVLSLHVPLLPSTHHLINKERLSMMKKTALLVNTSRGPVIDEVALVEALQNKTIAGAALDVFENEPKLAKGLEKLSNVILTPHIASATESTRNQMATVAAQNIIDFVEGREVKNKVK